LTKENGDFFYFSALVEALNLDALIFSFIFDQSSSQLAVPFKAILKFVNFPRPFGKERVMFGDSFRGISLHNEMMLAFFQQSFSEKLAPQNTVDDALVVSFDCDAELAVELMEIGDVVADADDKIVREGFGAVGVVDYLLEFRVGHWLLGTAVIITIYIGKDDDQCTSSEGREADG
jgi:hypothetical protein